MIVALDFEYRNTTELCLDLVCVAWSIDNKETHSIWLHNDKTNKLLFKNLLIEYRKEGAKLMCFNASAEAHGLVSLGLDPLKFDWIDLQCEWKMLTNHNDKLSYGSQLINGKEVKTTKKNYYGTTKKGKNHSKPDLSLVAMTYKLLGIKSDLEYKNKMRDLILKTNNFNDKQKQEIISYCESDVKELFELKKEVFKQYNSLPTRIFSKNSMGNEVLYRGKCSARSALIEIRGIPINVSKTENLADNVQPVLDDCAKEILELFPDIAPFRWNKKENRYSKCAKNIQVYIESSPYKDKWERTDKGAISLKLDAFKKHFSFQHDYPKDSFWAQMIRFLRLNQSFNGLKPKSVGSKSRNVFDSLGSDDRVRPYLNIYRAQSARFQPKANSFPFLWAAWIRAIVEPKPGNCIIGIDYASEEFLVAAILSGDEKMIDAYKSGDPYLYVGKEAGVIPKDGTKKSHPLERDMFKTVTLGISYLMTEVGLSKDLTEKLGRVYTKAEAKKLIDLFFKVFNKYGKYITLTQNKYRKQKHIKLIDGWYMFGDNINDRSVGNMPIQGMGSCILRKAIELSQDASLKVIFPLHDALYIECNTLDVANTTELFQKCMKDAFIYCFDNKEAASLIRLDTDIWGPDFKKDEIITIKGNEIKTKNIYIDPRSVSEYEKFKKYFYKGEKNGV